MKRDENDSLQAHYKVFIREILDSVSVGSMSLHALQILLHRVKVLAIIHGV